MNCSYVIYDKNENYAKRLMNSMHQEMRLKGGKHFEIQLFTEEQGLRSYLAENEPAVLIASEESYCQTIGEEYEGRKVILTEEYSGQEEIQKIYGEQSVGVYRYQTSEKILKQILEECPVQYRGSLSSAEIIGVYSPVTIMQKTAFILNMAKVLSDTYHLLYINLEEFSGLEELLENSSDLTLSDALYYYRQGQKTAISRISETINSVAGIDYIAPVRCAEDIAFMDAEQMMDFIITAGKCHDYEIILLDISNAVKQPWKMLDCCKKIYMPIKNDYLSLKKLHNFETYFIGAGLERILNNIVKVRLPEGENEITCDFWDKLQFGGMYRYVKKLLEQQEEGDDCAL